MTSSFKPEIIEATIAGMVFRKCVFLGERYLFACHSKADHLAGWQPMVSAWQTEEQARFYDEEAGQLGFDFHGWAKAEPTPDEAYPFPMWIVFEQPADLLPNLLRGKAVPHHPRGQHDPVAIAV